MYEARMEVRRIIKSLIMQQEMIAKLQPLLNKTKGSSYTQLEIDELRKLHRHTQKLDGTLNLFKDDHKAFKSRFIFNGKD
jgi:hypothetical protein